MDVNRSVGPQLSSRLKYLINYSDSHGAQGNNFGDPPTFHLAPPAVSLCHISTAWYSLVQLFFWYQVLFLILFSIADSTLSLYIGFLADHHSDVFINETHRNNGGY